MRKSKVTTTEIGVADAVSNAFGDMEGLKDELQDWYDNLPESFQNGSKGEQLQEAIYAIEGVSEVEAPDCAEGATCTYPSLSKKRLSRSDRRDEAVNMLHAAAGWARERIDELQAMEFSTDEEEDKPAESDAEVKDESQPDTEDERDNMVQDLETFADDCENAASEFESVEFPGMYG